MSCLLYIYNGGINKKKKCFILNTCPGFMEKWYICVNDHPNPKKQIIRVKEIEKLRNRGIQLTI